MNNKIISMLLSTALTINGIGIYNVNAEGKGIIEVSSIEVNAGDVFDLPIELKSNPGVAAMSLNLTYDTDKLELISATDGQILGSSTFLSGKDVTAVPYTLNWDDLSDENNTGTGTLASLSFKAKDNAVGSADVAVAVNQSSTFDIDFNDVIFETIKGTVSINSETGELVPAITVSSLTADTGSTVEVPIIMENNPGVAAVSLDVTYDNTKLSLASVEDGKILGTSTFLSGKDLTMVPYTLNWDDLSSENNTGNGTLAVLTFNVLDSDATDTSIKVSVNQKSTFNIDFEDVVFETHEGFITINKSSQDSTTTSTSTTTTTSDTTTTSTTTTTSDITTTSTTTTTSDTTTTSTTTTTSDTTTTSTTITTSDTTTTSTTTTTSDTTTTSTTTTTSDTTTSTSATSSNATTTATTSETITTTEDATISVTPYELSNWAENDYFKKTGVEPYTSTYTENADGTLTITLIDEAGTILDKYTVHPNTGVGFNSTGEEVNLPQTGNNSMKNWLIVFGALMLIGLGVVSVKTSRVSFRRKDEQ